MFMCTRLRPYVRKPRQYCIFLRLFLVTFLVTNQQTEIEGRTNRFKVPTHCEVNYAYQDCPDSLYEDKSLIHQTRVLLVS